MADSTNAVGKSVWQLLVVAALMGIGYKCNGMLRFTIDRLNLILECALYAIPLLALRPVLHLPRRPRIWGLILLSPVLFVSSMLLLLTVVGGFLGGGERREPMQTFQQGNSTIELQYYENGGALGIHGLNLEQRRLIVRGLYLVRSVDFFDEAWEGTLSVEGPYKVRVHAKGNYSSNDYLVDRVYNLKPWLYF